MKALNDFRNFYAKGDSMIRKLIIINAMVFILVSLVGVIFWAIGGSQTHSVYMDAFTGYFAVPADLSILIVRPWTLLTYAFFHGSIPHILFNMIFFYWLGNIFQEYLGNKKVLATYLWGSLFGAALYITAFNLIPVLVPRVPNAYMVGASAGIMAIVVGIGTFLPHYEVSIFRFFIPLKWIAIGFVVLDFIMMPQGNEGGHIAHLGGALFGFMYARHLRRSSKFGDSIEGLGNFFGGIFKKKPKLTVVKKQESPVYSKTTIADFEDEFEPSPELVDAILDKINQSGYESLTSQERELLFKASKQD
jgi:membrane associated rhomboid family serine protease